MKVFTTLLILSGIFTASSFAFAETYLYVDTSGELQTETAATPTEAIIEASDRAPHSGVMLVGAAVTTPTTQTTPELYDSDAEVYAYVAIDGDLELQVAQTPQQAIIFADDRAPHSGVIVVGE